MHLDPVNEWLRSQRRFVDALTGLGVRSYRLDEDDARSIAWEALWRAYLTHDATKGRPLGSWVIYRCRMDFMSFRAAQRRRGRSEPMVHPETFDGMSTHEGRRHVRARMALEEAPPCVACGTTGGAPMRSGRTARHKGMCARCYARERAVARAAGVG